MLKITRSLDKLASNKNNSSKPASSKNNSSKPIFRKNNGNGKLNRFGYNSIEHAIKLGKSKAPKLSKLRISKSEKLAKSKKPSKCRNFPHFGTKKTRLSF